MNSGGAHCLKYGVTVNNLLGLKVVTIEGEVLDIGGAHLDAAGYDWLGLLTGSEGMLVVVTEVTVRILHAPEGTRAMLVGFGASEVAGQCVDAIISSGIIPVALEFMDRPAIHACEAFAHAGYPLDAEALLIIEVEGCIAEQDHLLGELEKICARFSPVSMRIAATLEESAAIWKGRKGAFGAVGRISPDYFCMDGTIPTSKLPATLHRIGEMAANARLEVCNIFHAGDGNLHPLIMFDANDPDSFKRAEKLGEDILTLCVEVGGCLTGEHGVGIEKRDLMSVQFNPIELDQQRKLKTAFDPLWLLNPGKVFPLAAGGLSTAMLAPRDEAGIADAVAAAYAAREPLLVQGAGTKLGMLRPVQAARNLSVRGLTGVTLYAPKELVFAAQAGTLLADVEKTLAAEGQFMIAEPPDFSALLGGGQQSFGGVVATNLSGPRRVAWGAMRDHVLGVRAVNGVGAVIRGGGRVLKNVTGLDLCKLLTGSHGTLAVLTEITVKVLPRPESSASVVLRGLDARRGVAALSAALGSAFSVSGAAYLPAESASVLGAAESLTLARIEDFAVSVAYRTDRLRALLAEFGNAEIWPAADSVAAWAAVRDAAVLPAAADDAIWRVSVRPSQGPGVLAAALEAGARGYLDWGGGLVMLAGPATEAVHAAMTDAVRRAGGVWSLLRGPEGFRTGVDVVPAEAPALAAITRRVKAAMDPGGILNPGRMFAGV